jgi:hypothetical protein
MQRYSYLPTAVLRRENHAFQNRRTSPPPHPPASASQGIGAGLWKFAHATLPPGGYFENSGTDTAGDLIRAMESRKDKRDEKPVFNIYIIVLTSHDNDVADGNFDDDTPLAEFVGTGCASTLPQFPVRGLGLSLLGSDPKFRLWHFSPSRSATWSALLRNLTFDDR